VQLTRRELDAAMASMDGDGSGEVDFEEFCAWWEQADGEVEARERSRRRQQPPQTKAKKKKKQRKKKGATGRGGRGRSSSSSSVAAAVIQAAWRGWSTRDALLVEAAERAWAAKEIQRWVRGRQTRAVTAAGAGAASSSSSSSRRRPAPAAPALAAAAAARIQAHERGRQVRAEMQWGVSSWAATRVQATARGRLARRAAAPRLRRRAAAAEVLQAVCRTHLAGRTLGEPQRLVIESPWCYPPANSGGFDIHRDSITSCCGRRGAGGWLPPAGAAAARALHAEPGRPLARAGGRAGARGGAGVAGIDSPLN
jgi:hypothetical protein